MKTAAKMHKKGRDLEKDILVALFRYYVNDITFERAAENANIPIYFLIQYVNDNNLPIVHTEKDITDGIQKVVRLMERKGMDTGGLKLPVQA